MRQAEWRADQTIDRIRGSLTKLLAYQKVLKEDFPVKQLCALSGSGKSANKFATKKFGYRDQGCRGHSATDCLREGSRPSATSGHFDNVHSRSINEVYAANEAIAEDQIKNDETIRSDDGMENSISQSKNVNDGERKCNFPVEQTPHHFDTGRLAQKNESNKTLEVGSAGLLHKRRIPEVRRKLLHLRANITEPRASQDESARDDTRGFNSHVMGGEFTDRRQTTRETIPHDSLGIPHKACADSKHQKEESSIPQSRYPVLDTSEESQMAGPLTDAQRAWHEKRIKRKDAVTQRILTRGFDMRTLAWEIDRKLVVMDSGYARQRERRKLVSESRGEVAR